MPPDERFRRFLRLSAVLYGLGALNAVALRRRVERELGRIDRTDGPPEDFWPALGTAYMATITAVAWAASRDRLTAARLAPPLFVAKGVTTALFAYRFLRTRRLSYALSALTDAALLGATVWLAKRAEGPAFEGAEAA